MSEVRFATTALYLGACHAMGVIGSINNAAFADGFVEAGPSATAFKFGIAFKKGIATNGTIVGANFTELFKLARPGPFGTLLPGYIINLFGEHFLPFFVADGHFAGIGAGIGRVFLIGAVHGRGFRGG